jgi:hypothetical protein
VIPQDPAARLSPADAARSLYEPLAVDETRRAVARYLDAKRRHEEARDVLHEAHDNFGTSGNSLDRLATFTAALHSEWRAAMAHLIRLLVAWDEQALDTDSDDAEWRYWPPRGAIVDGTVYLAVPARPDDCEDMEYGERGKEWMMTLHAFPLASVVDVDNPPRLEAPPSRRRARKAVRS